MNKKQTIQNTALGLFVEKGYLKTPVRDIIDGSGHGTSTFYRHFRNKEDVLRSLLEKFLSEILSSLKDYYKTEDDFRTRFIETKRVLIEVFIAHRELAELYVKSAGLGNEIEKCIADFDDSFIDILTKNVTFGIKKGAFRDVQPGPIAHGILGTIKYSVYNWIVLKRITEQELIETVLSFHESLGSGLFKDYT